MLKKSEDRIMSKYKTCCFTGHRKIPTNEFYTIYEQTKNQIETLVQNGYNNFIAGGALGFDTLAATAVINVKKEYPRIRLILHLPCKEQTKYWNERDKRIYEHIKSVADEIYYVSEHYTPTCLNDRNKTMVNASNVVIAYKRKESGGTANCVRYAKSKNRNIIYI